MSTTAPPAPLLCDLQVDGTRHMYSAYLLRAPEGGFVVVETGPTSGLARLTAAVAELGCELDELRAILLTHIHLDHAGGAGTLARRTGAPVYCHPAAVRHLIDPSHLVNSSRALFGDAYDRLWGEMVPVAEAGLWPVADGAEVVAAGLRFTAWHTPGHARHHLAWQLGDTVFAGDVAGIRLPGCTYVWPPTPPSDFDLEAWCASLDLLRRLAPRRLYLTHFGPVDDVTEHLDQLQGRLERWTALARRVIAEGGGTAAVGAALRELDEAEIAAAGVPAEVLEVYQRNNPSLLNAAGLRRYLSHHPG